MDNILDWFYRHKIKIIASFILIISIIGGAFYLVYIDKEEENNLIGEITEELEAPKIEEKEEPEKEEEKKVIIPSWRVDMKGCIKNPGVYQVNENTRIYEVIEMAGGLTKDATTTNINLSKKVSDEMVIYIYSNEEWKNKCNCKIENDYQSEISKEVLERDSIIEKEEKKETSEKKISLNQATKEELMMLDGIGSQKADSIIEYRTKNNGFQSIEELKKISGIGEALYEKIKENLTL